MTQQPTTKPKPVQVAPTRERLEMMLINGPDLIDVVQGFIDEFKLKFKIELVFAENHPTMPPEKKKEFMGQKVGVLKDTLSRGELHLNTFITEDEEMLGMKVDALKCANYKEPHEVLITGESGTGKEIIGKAMIGHRDGEIKAINCAALPEHLIESELFGHLRGSFTGADKEKEGLCSSAKNGVLFLDEIGDLPLPVQSKLLRAIQERRIRKVGATVDEEISCRFVCATWQDVKKMVSEGRFRKDLYARISVLELHISPLRDRPVDVIPILKSIKGHEAFLVAHEKSIKEGLLDLSLNVRSLQRYVTRYNVLGKVKI